MFVTIAPARLKTVMTHSLELRQLECCGGVDGSGTTPDATEEIRLTTAARAGALPPQPLERKVRFVAVVPHDRQLGAENFHEPDHASRVTGKPDAKFTTRAKIHRCRRIA